MQLWLRSQCYIGIAVAIIAPCVVSWVLLLCCSGVAVSVFVTVRPQCRVNSKSGSVFSCWSGRYR